MARKDLLAKSASLLSLPAIDMAAKCEDSFAMKRKARARTSCWPTLERLLLSLLAQDTAEVLSTQAAA